MSQVRGPVEVVGVAVDSDEVVGDGGFLAVRRTRLRNRRADGSTSAPYVCDFVHRGYGQDAVVVVLYRRIGARVEVLLRAGLRPALHLGRSAEHAPLPEPPCDLYLTELVAGIVEPGDRGIDGLYARAVAEAAEEAGAALAPAALRLLGAGTFPSPGSMVEKFYFVAGELAAELELAAPSGDGSPLEESARLSWMELHEAIAASMSGALCDAKTELGLRRLRDELAKETA